MPDPKTNQHDVYEGVALKEIAPNSTGRRVDVFEDTWAFRDRLAISSVDFDLQSDVIVAYNKNGKRLAGHPFCLIAKNTHGDMVIVPKLSFVRFDKTPQIGSSPPDNAF